MYLKRGVVYQIQADEFCRGLEEDLISEQERAAKLELLSRGEGGGIGISSTASKVLMVKNHGFVLNMMNLVLKMMDYVSKMMNFT